MGMSLSEATETLLAGKKLAWPKYKEHKSGSITLDKPAQRRLFKFLLSCNPSDVVQGSESLFDSVIKAWKNTEYDPAAEKIEASAVTTPQSWRLDRIEASGFGGLTSSGGKNFDLFVGESNWCLEGQNGSGKTSLVSAVLWALTGKRIREHEGPVDERGERQSVQDSDGKSIGKWPPLAAYPPTIADLGKEAALLQIARGMPVGAMVLGRRSMEVDIWLSPNQRCHLDRAVIVGNTLSTLYAAPPKGHLEAAATYDRQIRMFGNAGQPPLLSEGRRADPESGWRAAALAPVSEAGRYANAPSLFRATLVGQLEFDGWQEPAVGCPPTRSQRSNDARDLRGVG